MTRDVQTTQNNKFAISLQYLKKAVSDEVDFLHTNKHESFLQIGAMIFDVHNQAFTKFVKWQVCYVFTIFQKRSYKSRLNIKDEQRFLQVDFNSLDIKVSCKVILSLVGMIKHSQYLFCNIFTVFQKRKSSFLHASKH